MNDSLSAGAVTALLVTYNRSGLMRTTLDAVLSQEHALSEVVVVDNASVDDTPRVLDEYGDKLTRLRLDVNVGPAGAFHEGLKTVLMGTSEWVWLLADDAVARPDSLRRLTEAAARLAVHRPVALAARVEWTDGSLHPMNVVPARGEADVASAAAQAGTYPMRSASLMGLLVRTDAIRRYGLPYRDYYIWHEDFEWTTRLMRHELGVVVPDSVVVHDSPNPYGTTEDPGDRFYYEVRNKIWTLKMSGEDGWVRQAAFAGIIATEWARAVRRSPNPGRLFKVGLRGAAHGVARRPQA